MAQLMLSGVAQYSTKLVIGTGNEDRGDDAIGLVVASRLEARAEGRFKVMCHVTDAVSLIEAWRGADIVVIVDASSSGAPPGTIRRFDATAQPPERDALRYSTHAFGITEAVELARALDRLPARLIIYAIEGENFELRKRISPALLEAAREVETMILAEFTEQDAT